VPLDLIPPVPETARAPQAERTGAPLAAAPQASVPQATPEPALRTAPETTSAAAPETASAAAPETASRSAPETASRSAPETATTPQTSAARALQETPQPAPAGGGRIIVRARTNSWIQVRDGNAGELLMTRLLRAGDTYAVPDRAGLMLSTGNAGALEILVDGAAVPAIGSAGAVRRNVALDADKLKAGTASAP